MSQTGEALLAGGLAAVAGCGGIGALWLLAGAAVPTALLPAALLGGAVVASRWRSPAPEGAAAPRWLQALAAAAVLALAAVLAHGALATPPRHWDGAVAWDLKARALAAAPTLDQPLFRDPAVLAHSRDYPLLQPLWLGLSARLGVAGGWWFAAAFVALCGLVHTGARRLGHAGSLAILLALGTALTPMLTTPTSGSFDSGYADPLLAVAATAAALGLAVADRRWLALGLAVLVLAKPEGLAYALAATAAVWWRGPQRLVAAALATTAVAGAVVLAQVQDLRALGQAGALALAAPGLGLALGAALAAGLGRWLDRRGAPVSTRRWWLLGLGGAAAVALPWLGERAGALGAFATAPERLLARLGEVPTVLSAMLHWALLRGAFGLCFVLGAAVALWRVRSPRPPGEGALGAWLWLLAAVWVVAFLASPLPDLEHDLRSRLPRLLLHAVGPVWLWLASRTAPLPPALPVQAAGRDLAAAAR